jgi:hypothetical protein
MNDHQLVCGCQVQVERGRTWVDVAADDIPANIREEIEGEIIDGGREECDGVTLSNGLRYRWA